MTARIARVFACPDCGATMQEVMYPRKHALNWVCVRAIGQVEWWAGIRAHAMPPGDPHRRGVRYWSEADLIRHKQAGKVEAACLNEHKHISLRR